MAGLGLSREQLSTFLKDPDAIRKFEQLFTTQTIGGDTLSNVTVSVGLNTNGTYVFRSGTKYLDSAASVRDEATLLDLAVYRSQQYRAYTITANTTISTVENAIYLANCASGSINITLPSPTSFYSSGYTFSITITKTDTTQNRINIIGTVNGKTNLKIGYKNTSITLISNGTEWRII